MEGWGGCDLGKGGKKGERRGRGGRGKRDGIGQGKGRKKSDVPNITGRWIRKKIL